MDEPRTPTRDRTLVGLLLLLSLGLRAWQLTHTEVAARDSIGFIRFAWRMHQGETADVLRTSPQHPGYPFAILVTSVPVGWVISHDLPRAWQLSAQLASALASVLLVVPMYLLGRELFDRRVGFWAAAYFQCLPSSGRLLGDGLSEPLFLLWAACALYTASRALRTGGAGGFAAAGLFAGLAYLTRPEGALLAAATGAVLLGLQLTRKRQPWRSLSRSGLALAVGFVVVAAPLVACTGRLTTKPTANRVLEALTPEPAASGPALTTGPPLAAWWAGDSQSPEARQWWGLHTLGRELVAAFFSFGWVPAVVGLWWFRDRFRAAPGCWVVLFVCLAVAASLYRVAIVMGYLSDRHTVLILLGGLYPAAAFLLVLCGAVARSRKRVVVGLMAALAAAALARTLEPLHAQREGFKQAGRWLAANALPGDLVEDPFCWSHYYAGRVFLETARGPLPRREPPVRYIVVERSANAHSRLPTYPEEVLQTARGKVVWEWDVARGKVLVYEVP